MKQISIASIVCAFLTGCAGNALKPADISLVKPYSFSMEDDKPMPSPYLARFDRDGKQLLYIASEHIALKGYTSHLDHPTLRTIRRAFNEYRPAIVVVEGIATGSEISPKSILSKVDECLNSSFRGDCGESLFAIAEARDRGADWVSGEPDEIELKRALEAAGVSEIDLLGFYLVRQVPQWKRRGDLDPKSHTKVLQEQIAKFKLRLQVTGKYELADFNAWYTQKVGPWKSLWSTEPNDTAPHGGNEATYLQRISHKVGIVRDQAIVRRIETALREYPSVLAIFGASHLLTQREALISMAGQPRYFSLKFWANPETATRTTKENPGWRR